MKNRNKKSIAALTLLDVIIVIAFVLIMAGLLLPRIQKGPGRSPRIECVRNLKQVSLGWRLWSNDNGNQFPWNVRFQDGGMMNNDASEPMNIVRQFLVASNEIGSPKVANCPSDYKKTRISNWEEFRIQPANSHPNISYFYNQDATPSAPQMILSGDRNLVPTKNAPIPRGEMGTVSLILNGSNYNAIDWDQETLHQGAGNVSLADGSVQQVNRKTLRAQAALVLKGTTNQMRLIYPGY